ncbi:hypothetical protein Q8A73_000123 [Channa argus]|nr:hypothetical protein Q8A73_000123 [Channa argus]
MASNEDEVSVGKVKKSVHYGLEDETDPVKVTAHENVIKQMDMEIENTYIIRNYGFVPGRDSGGALILLKPNTMVFQTATLSVPEEFVLKATQTLHPPSFDVTVFNETCKDKVVTMHGRLVLNIIVEANVVGLLLSTVSRSVDTKDGLVPVRDTEVLCCDGNQHIVTLWRKAALEKVDDNSFVKITHLRFTERCMESNSKETEELQVTIVGTAHEEDKRLEI